MMPRKTVFRGTWIRHGGHYPVYHLRLFKKDKGRCEQRLYDQHFIINGNIGTIRADIINIINPDLEKWKAAHKKWACLEAQEIASKRSRETEKYCKASVIEKRNWCRNNVYYKMPLFIRAAAYFLYRYLLRLGFLDGRQGLVFHFWQGFWYRMQVDKEIEAIKNGSTPV